MAKSNDRQLVHEQYQKALDVIEKPIYLLYHGDFDPSNIYRYLVYIDPSRYHVLRVKQDGSDAEAIITAVREHHECMKRCSSVQEVYDRMMSTHVTKYVWIVPIPASRYYRAFNSNNSDGHVFNKETTILHARYSGSEDKVDAAIARHYESFSNHIWGNVSDAAALKFLAIFIQQEQDLGIDWLTSKRLPNTVAHYPISSEHLLAYFLRMYEN